MSATETERLPKRPTPRLPAAKGHELLGLVLATGALLLAASLVSYHPADPSFLHELPPSRVRVHNWSGAVGAQVAALLLGLLGLSALLLPLGLAAPAWSMLRRRAERPRVAGRGVGFALLVLSAPVLLQLLAGPLSWRGERIDSGGVLGRFLAEVLVERFNFAGSLVLVGALATVAVSLLVQTTLGEVLAGWRDRLMLRWERVVLWWSRWQQRRDKEKLRKRVVDKHLKRRESEEVPAALPVEVTAPRLEIDLPLRVTERSGDRGFAVRKVRLAAEPESLDLDFGEARHAALAAPAAAGGPAGAAPPRRAREAASGGKPQPLLFAPPSEAKLPPLNLLNLETAKQTIAEDRLIRLGETIRRSEERRVGKECGSRWTPYN